MFRLKYHEDLNSICLFLFFYGNWKLSALKFCLSFSRGTFETWAKKHPMLISETNSKQRTTSCRVWFQRHVQHKQFSSGVRSIINWINSCARFIFVHSFLFLRFHAIQSQATLRWKLTLHNTSGSVQVNELAGKKY